MPPKRRLWPRPGSRTPMTFRRGRSSSTGRPTESPDRTADEYYIVKTKAPVDGTMLKEAGFDSQTTNGSYSVTMDFNDTGAKAFAAITKELAEIGSRERRHAATGHSA